MSSELHDALENCITLIQHGVDPEQALSLYPDLADELREPLSVGVTLASMQTIKPSRQAIRSSRGKLLALVEDRSSRRRRWVINWPRMRPAWALGVVVSVLAVSSILTASAQALPGGALYPLKRAMERLRYALTLSDQSQANLEAEFRRERIYEAQALIEGGLQSTVSLQGQVDRIEQSLLIVDGIPVQVAANWESLELVLPGDWVTINGRIDDGIVWASSAERIPSTWTGLIENMGPSTWIIEGREFIIDTTTAGRQSFQIGDLVTVMIAPDIHGDWRASSLIPPGGESLTEALAELDQERNERVAAWTDRVVSIHTTWIQIGQVIVRIGDFSELDSDLRPGDWVEVKARWDGDWWALEIENLDHQEFDSMPGRESIEGNSEEENQEIERQEDERQDEETSHDDDGKIEEEEDGHEAEED